MQALNGKQPSVTGMVKNRQNHFNGILGPMSGVSAALADELIKIRLVGANKTLRRFIQKLETWELLLIVYMLSGDGRYGIEDYLDHLQTIKCTRLTMRNFIRDRVAEGTFVAVSGDKKSRKSLILSDALRSELEIYLGLLDEVKSVGSSTLSSNYLHRGLREGLHSEGAE